MKHKTVEFSPLHGLASLGAGGLSISFFIWLMFLTPHPDSPVPTYESLLLAKSLGSAGWITLVTTLVAVMSVAHYGLLIWWLMQGRQTPDASRAAQHEGQSHIFKMILPLVLAMSVNVSFVLGVVFVPHLWKSKEILFPFALFAFLLLFLIATKRWLDQRASLTMPGISYKGKGLIELLATFAFAMITVGFSASAAMSHSVWIYTSGMALSFLGLGMSIWTAIRVLIDRVPVLKVHPIAATSTGSLLMGVPILTVLGIATYRVMVGNTHHFGITIGQDVIAGVLATIFISQILIFMLATPTFIRTGGWLTLMAREPQGASFSLICPGVGFFVLGMFVVAKGLTPLGWLSDSWVIVVYCFLGSIQLVTLAMFAYLIIHAMPGKHKRRKLTRMNHADD